MAIEKRPSKPRGCGSSRPSRPRDTGRVLARIEGDLNVGSVTRDLLETVGRELAALWEQLEAVYESGFVETANRRRPLRLGAAALIALGIAYGVTYRKRKALGLSE
jgi:hypothetical protein